MRIQNPRNLSREAILKYLSEGICEVSFIKVKDGTNRDLLCTLHSGLIPTQFEKSLHKIFQGSSPDPDIVPIWAVAEGEWRSFRISKLNLFLTSDELTKENEEGQSTESKLGNELIQQRDRIVKEFKQRVANLKEKARREQQNINGVE